MHLKRYHQPTVREALAQAREELGPNALVLSTRLVPAAGWRGWLGAREVEVTAAVDSAVSGARLRPQHSRQAADGRPAPGVDGHADIVARLVASGLDRDLAREIADALPRSRRRGASLVSLQRALADRLGALAAADTALQPIEMFVGPPGAGKTTTIAKIAAQQRASGAARPGVIAADGYRAGAIEQLRLYADIIGVPFQSARSASELERALATSRLPVLVDTAGRSPGDPSARELFSLLAGRPGVRTHLVMAAGTGVREAERVFDRYGPAQPDRVVLTKIDEADSLSPLVSLLRRRQLPISYLGTGQRVPDDLERATPPRLAGCVLGESTISAAGEVA